MLPSISTVGDIEMIRDGGSLQASFFGPNGSLHCLYFRLASQLDSQGKHKRSGYSSPIVFERLEFRHLTSFEWQSVNEVEVSWEHAAVILHQFHSHPLSDAQVRWLNVMEEVASLKGGTPGILQNYWRTAGDA